MVRDFKGKEIIKEVVVKSDLVVKLEDDKSSDDHTSRTHRIIFDVPMQTEEEDPLPLDVPMQTEKEDLFPLDVVYPIQEIASSFRDTSRRVKDGCSGFDRKRNS
ncbi:hypothetical protein Tco_1333105 [Tanacetum coccineum]